MYNLHTVKCADPEFTLISFDKRTPQKVPSCNPFPGRPPRPELYPCLVLLVVELHRNGVKCCVSELDLVNRKLILYKMASEEVHSPRVFLSLEASVAHPHPAP